MFGTEKRGIDLPFPCEVKNTSLTLPIYKRSTFSTPAIAKTFCKVLKCWTFLSKVSTSAPGRLDRHLTHFIFFFHNDNENS